MTTLTDLTLLSRDGQVRAIAEVKNRRNTSREWAAQLRRNIFAHGGFPDADFFLVVTPDRLYLWQGHGSQATVIDPDYEIDGTPIFAPYLERSGLDPRTVSGHAFELVVAAWLSDLARFESPAGQGALLESGFQDAIKEGRLEYPAAA